MLCYTGMCPGVLDDWVKLHVSPWTWCVCLCLCICMYICVYTYICYIYVCVFISIYLYNIDKTRFLFLNINLYLKCLWRFREKTHSKGKHNINHKYLFALIKKQNSKKNENYQKEPAFSMGSLWPNVRKFEH